MATAPFAASPGCQCRDLAAPWLAGASSQTSAMSLDMGKTQSLLANMQPLRGASIRGDRRQKLHHQLWDLLGWWGVQSPGCRSLPQQGMFAAQGCQGSENSPAQLGCTFFGCTKWKILSCRQNIRCEEEHGAGCLLQELGLEQQAPHMAKLCQLWLLGRNAGTILSHPMLGIAFTAASHLDTLHGKI